MSEENVEIAEARFVAALQSGDTGPALDGIREMLKTFDTGGVEAIAETLHPDFELDARGLLDTDIYHGIDGLRRWRQENREAMEYDRFEPQAVRIVDESRIVVFGRLHTKGRASGVETDVPFTHVYEIQDGKTRRLSLYLDVAEALKAAGLAE